MSTIHLVAELVDEPRTYPTADGEIVALLVRETVESDANDVDSSLSWNVYVREGGALAALLRPGVRLTIDGRIRNAFGRPVIDDAQIAQCLTHDTEPGRKY